MEPSDKIYIPKNIAPHLTEEWASHTHGSLGEYIRKEALLEWATNLKERWKEPPVSVHSPGCVYMLEQVIDKLNEM